MIVYQYRYKNVESTLVTTEDFAAFIDYICLTDAMVCTSIAKPLTYRIYPYFYKHYPEDMHASYADGVYRVHNGRYIYDYYLRYKQHCSDDCSSEYDCVRPGCAYCDNYGWTYCDNEYADLVEYMETDGTDLIVPIRKLVMLITNYSEHCYKVIFKRELVYL